MSLSFFCCLLLIRNVLIKVFSYVVDLNFYVITPWFVWSGNWAASCLSVLCVLLEHSSHLGPGFISTPRFCWETEIVHYLDLREIYLFFQENQIKKVSHLWRF